MWRTGKRLYGNASDLVTMIKTLSGVSLGSDLQPRGVCRHPIACANNFRGDAECRSGAVNNTCAEHWLAFRHASGTEQCTGGEKHG